MQSFVVSIALLIFITSLRALCIYVTSMRALCVYTISVRALCVYIQSNLDGSNTDSSFTMANSNSFLNPYEVPIAQENKYLMIFFFFIYREIVVCVYSLESPHRGDSNKYTQHTITV